MFPIASIDGAKRVIYIGSFSKVLATAIRVGYIAASSELIAQCAAEIMIIDRQGNSITELAVSELMNSGEIKRHILKTTKIYKERRDALAALVYSELGQYVTFDTPNGGLAFWMLVKTNIDTATVVARIKANKLTMPLGLLFSDSDGRLLGLRLGFGSLSPSEMNRGVSRLKSVFSGLN